MKSIILATAITVFFALNISAQLKVLSNGNVGIGTFTPECLLNLKGNIPQLRFEESDNGNKKWHIEVFNKNLVFVESGIDTRLAIMEGGNTGIGTGNPNSTLHINSTSGNPFRIEVNGSSKFILGSNGGATIGVYQTPPANGLWVYGLTYTQNGYYVSSDEKFKTNIKGIESSLEKVMNLRGVTYNRKFSKLVNIKDDNYANNLKSSNLQNENYEVSDKIEYGLIAQETEKVVPEAVREMSDGTKAVCYDSMIPLLIEAIKEQQGQIETLKKQLITKDLKSTSTQPEELSSNEALGSLDQNNPNPFNQSTQIWYYLPENTNHAVLNVYDMNGMQIKSISINSLGKGKITINALELQPGMYFYTLIADGKEIDTKRMILTE
jgi:hypothetical protein